MTPKKFVIMVATALLMFVGSELLSWHTRDRDAKAAAQHEAQQPSFSTNQPIMGTP